MAKADVISEDQKAMARFAKAMGHPIRMYVLELLSKQSCCYSGDLTEVLPIAKSTLSQHLKELKDAGLIQGEIEAPKIKYCLNRENWNLAQSLFNKLLNSKILDYKNMVIKVLGTGCARCKSLEKVTRKAVDELNLDASVEKVEDIQKIMEFAVMRTPALVIDEKVVLSGQVPKVSELKELITKNL